ncbi:MAG TPA: Na+/H+ antiporter [Opitutaceae bacterium]|jgi:Na+/H+ antiporter|nr:Na+/H+ antiporter [Opitutaceae bacterium]
MAAFQEALILLLLTTILSVVARWIPWPRPITYVLGGIGFALIPDFPRFALDPEFFFLCFLPPLLFSDGWLMPLREFAKAKRPIILLATGLVVLTTLGVGLVAHWLVPGLPLAMAFALGAVVSPTDAVAVSAITNKLKIPTRLTTVLNGESLMNDATGLVAFKFALAAIVAGTFSLHGAVLDFVLLAAGGLGVGLLVGWLVGRLRDLLIRTHNADHLIELTLSLLTPYAAYLAAGPLGVSGILAVVAAGLYSGWRDPVRMDAETRRTTWTVWSTVLFWLNGLAFVLLGLQFPTLLAAVHGQYSLLRLTGFVAVVAGTVMVLRMAWAFPASYLPFVFSRKIRETETRPPWQVVFVGGWAGLRGTVTLAAALSIPLLQPDGTPFPSRNIVIFLAFGVIATTLLVQGTTMSWLIRRLGLHDDGIYEKEDHLARTTAVSAGLKALRELESPDNNAAKHAALKHVLAEYEERLSELVAEVEARRTHARARLAAEKIFRFAALEAERKAVDDLWSRDVITDEVHRPLQQLLDHEEAMLRAQPEHPAE